MRGLILACSIMLLGACDREPSSVKKYQADPPPMMANPVVHFEIPVNDIDRAVRFYEAVFGYTLRRDRVDGYAMAFFPRTDGGAGASGALAQGDVYKPAKSGPVLYFDVADIDAVLARARAQGAEILYPKKDIGDAGFVAEIEDSEGNRIALSEPKD